MSRGFASKTNRARKVVAVIASAALVASMSNFQAFAADGDVAPTADEPKVAVIDFDIADGMKVVFDGKTVKNGSSFEVSTSQDATFTVKAKGSDKPLKIGEITCTMADLPPVNEQPRAQGTLTEAAEANQNNAVATEAPSPVTDPVATPSSSEGPEVSVDDPSVAVTPELASEADTDEPVLPLAETGGTEETIADNATPQAYPVAEQQAAASAEDDQVHVIEVKFENGRYVISHDALMEAAKAQKKIVVKITASEIESKETADSWERLKELLEAENVETAITLEADIEVEIEQGRAVEVKGSKSLQLAGHHITVKNPAADATIFDVAKGASLTIADNASDGIEAQGAASEETTSSEKYADKDTAQLATYDQATKTLTYYVTHSETDRQTGTTRETRDTMKLVLTDEAGSVKTGSIEAQSMDSLVKVNEDASLAVSGGLLTNQGGKHAINATKAKTVSIDGGFIMGNGVDVSAVEGSAAAAPQANGAGIYFQGKSKGTSSLTIGDTAYIAGNIVSEKNNGGGVWATNCTMVIDGNAVIAGNKASNGSASSVVVAQNRVKNSNGGGIYVEANSNVRIAGNATIAGNRAAADGGGIYVKSTATSLSKVCSNTLTLADACCITNNVSDHDYTKQHPTDGVTKADWKDYAGGGGGIFSGGDTHIVSAEITGNYASDTGGGLFVPGEYQFVMPTLTIDYAVIAGNTCITSEGGGFTVMPAPGSCMRMGYITNNSTVTEFDYGGGGLFIPSGGNFEVLNPVVMKNTADGYGGGVGACTNGTVITSDAAIFDNVANHQGYTTNPNEYGDQWASLKRLDLPPHSADDYFCARSSTVYNNMLGGGVYNWNGYMSGKAGNKAEFVKGSGWLNANNKVTIKDPKNKVVATYKFPNSNFENGYAYVFLPQTMTLAEVQKAFVGATATFTGGGYTLSAPNNPRPGLITSVADGKEDFDGGANFGKCHKYILNLNFDITKPTAEGGAVYVDNSDTVAAEGVVKYFKSFMDDTNKDPGASYHVYEILDNKFPENGHAVASRFMALKAHPFLGTNDEAGAAAAKAAAIKEASVFVTGNYSANNGGGIGCNGVITIGKNPNHENPDDPKLPEDIFDLTINKSWTNLKDLAAENGTITTAFVVRAYQSKAAYEADASNCKFETVIGMTFDAESGSRLSRTVKDLKKGWYIVAEELGVAGDNFTVDSATETVTIKKDEAVSFENTYNDDKTYGTGVVNSYGQGTDGDSNVDGVHVSQDTVYKKNRPAAASEQGSLANPTDPVAAQAAGE